MRISADGPIDLRAFAQLTAEVSSKTQSEAPHSPLTHYHFLSAYTLLLRLNGNPKLERMEQRLAAQNAEQGELENNAMLHNIREDEDILELLKAELAFIEQGGYGRSVRTPWLPKSVFQDSLSCINYADPNHTHPCSECQLMGFVSTEHQAESVPCHFISLNEAGETIADLEAQDNQAKLEATLKEWMRTKIKEIEEARAMRAALRTEHQQASA